MDRKPQTTDKISLQNKKEGVIAQTNETSVSKQAKRQVEQETMRHHRVRFDVV